MTQKYIVIASESSAVWSACCVWRQHVYINQPMETTIKSSGHTSPVCEQWSRQHTGSQYKCV